MWYTHTDLACCHNKIVQAGWLKLQKWPVITVLEAGSPGARCGWFDFSGASLLNLQWEVFLLYPHMAFSFFMDIPGVSFSSCKDTSFIGLGPYSYDLI